MRYYRAYAEIQPNKISAWLASEKSESVHIARRFKRGRLINRQEAAHALAAITGFEMVYGLSRPQKGGELIGGFDRGIEEVFQVFAFSPELVQDFKQKTGA